MSQYGTGYGSYGGGPSSSGGVDPDMHRHVQTVASNIQKIVQNVNAIQGMIPKIGTSQDNPQFQDRLHNIQHETGQLAKDTSVLLKDIAAKPGANQRPWRLQRDRLHDDFTSALNKFQSYQRMASQKERDEIKKAKQHTTIGGPLQREANLIDVENADVSSTAPKAGQSRTQMLIEEEEEIKRLEERERSVRQLEADIVDVNSIFKDLATMVHEQGEMVDSIEANIESTSIHVGQGAEQLAEAETHKVAARKKKLILALIAVFILVLIIIVGTQFN